MSTGTQPISPGGLSVDRAIELVLGDEGLHLLPDTADRLKRDELVSNTALRRGDLVYGLSRGVGADRRSQIDESNRGDLASTLLSYGSESVDDPFCDFTVRAAILLRIQTLVSGASGISPWLVQCLLDSFNRRDLPRINRSGSVGSGDLGEMGQLARFLLANPEVQDSDLRLSARDPLALVSSNAFGLGETLRLVVHAGMILRFACSTVAHSLALFRGNPSPFSPGVSRNSRRSGEVKASQLIDRTFAGIVDGRDCVPRDVQDPLSFRTSAVVLGVAFDAVDDLSESLESHMNSSDDNPSISHDRAGFLSTAHFDTTPIAHFVDGLNSCLIRVATQSTARLSKVRWPEFNPDISPGTDTAPKVRAASGLLSRMRSAGTPPSTLFDADIAMGVEDWSSNLPLCLDRCFQSAQDTATVVGLESSLSDGHEQPANSIDELRARLSAVDAAQVSDLTKAR